MTDSRSLQDTHLYTSENDYSRIAWTEWDNWLSSRLARARQAAELITVVRNVRGRSQSAVTNRRAEEMLIWSKRRRSSLTRWIASLVELVSSLCLITDSNNCTSTVKRRKDLFFSFQIRTDWDHPWMTRHRSPMSIERWPRCESKTWNYSNVIRFALDCGLMVCFDQSASRREGEGPTIDICRVRGLFSLPLSPVFYTFSNVIAMGTRLFLTISLSRRASMSVYRTKDIEFHQT